MLVASREVSKKSANIGKKPIIRKNQATGEMVAGFLEPETGVF